MCRALSFETNIQNRYRSGCLEKCLSRPPVMCRHEWQDRADAHSSTTLPTRITLPRPKPNPFVPWKATIAPQVLTTQMSTAAEKQQRCGFCTTSGQRVSPLDVLRP